MRVVVDTNSLESDELAEHFSASRNNYAVVPEHTAAEIFRPKDDRAIFAALSILCRFPEQVIILKGNRKLNAIDPRRGAIANAFIDRDSTRKFPSSCALISEAERGKSQYLRQISERREWAVERIQNTQNAFGDFSEILEEFESNFDGHELRELRANRPLKDITRLKILMLVEELANDMVMRQFKGGRIFRPPYRYNQFVWRYTLCHVIQLLQVVKKGAKRRAPEKVRNDHFDNVFATFGTYFNGVMSYDNGTNETHQIARIILRSLKVRLAPDYLFDL